MNEYGAHLLERGVSPESVAALAAPPQPPFSEALQGVLSAANNLLVAAGTTEHCRYPETSLHIDVAELRDACVAYLTGLPEETNT